MAVISISPGNECEEESGVKGEGGKRGKCGRGEDRERGDLGLDKRIGSRRLYEDKERMEWKKHREGLTEVNI